MCVSRHAALAASGSGIAWQGIGGVTPIKKWVLPEPRVVLHWLTVFALLRSEG